MGLLGYYNITIKSSRDRYGHHSFHLSVLQAFDREDNPLQTALGTKWDEVNGTRKPHVALARQYIDNLRKWRNRYRSPQSQGISMPKKSWHVVAKSDYRVWYTTVMRGLVEALKICMEDFKTKGDLSRIKSCFPCDNAYCMSLFRKFEGYKEHVKQEHLGQYLATNRVEGEFS